jgi:hypothetical protein
MERVGDASGGAVRRVVAVAARTGVRGGTDSDRDVMGVGIARVGDDDGVSVVLSAQSSIAASAVSGTVS